MLLPVLSAAALLLLAVFFIVPLARLLLRQRSSPLRNLPGPPCPSFFIGNLAEMHDQENTNLIATWQDTYGPTFVYRGFIGGPRLMTTDPVALAHVLAHAYQYPKPDFVRDSLASMAAGHDGLLTVEGDQHRRQRRILGPAFSKLHLASLTPLRDIWLKQADGHQHTPPRIDALSWLARATLDVIGEAGFGYHFNSLSSPSTDNELATAFAVIFSTARKFRVITILQVWFPILRRFRRNNAAMIQAHATMDRIGIDLINQKRTEILTESSHKTTSRAGRDLLSLLMRSNLANSAPSSPSSPLSPYTAQTQTSMSTREVLCQISTFIAAGHETTASALTWCLYALARAPHVQTKLRAALRSIALGYGATGDRAHDQEAEMEEEKAGQKSGHQQAQEQDLAARLQGCEYLDWVVREALRLHSPVTSTMRVCMRPGGDDIPLSVPVGPPSTRSEAAEAAREKVGSGERWSVRVAEGDIISIPIQAVNRCRRLWGEDAGEFRPERWAGLPAGARSIPGLLGGTLTFLNGNGSVGAGNRACIGWRFALIEIKIFLYTLVKDMEFWMDEDMVIEKRIK
ncbi:hypothetical protein D9615_002825 [Tricholomella constricta]|uniref:Cytochrome P450 n=1 Tax=Tricholomella constricta TaxID=117010 RepID=A0A8H5HGG3_9AGAR|nr:hypothetical protein D9615_002825 [Tricholomella constricta]